jgi:outer membrane receptor for ferrienterochelin and colicin
MVKNRVIRAVVRRSALSLALGMCFASGVQAQTTTGAIYGNVPGGAGTTVLVQNESGMSRTVPVDASGRYNVSNLPVGTYTVTLQRDGQTVDSRRNVTVLVGGGIDVSFGAGPGSTADATTLETLTVTASMVAPIDVTSVDTRTVITAEQLERLPMRRSAESIALLSPGAVSGAAGFAALQNLVSFGGAGVSENAYYINGYFSGDPLSNLGGFGVPYNAIDQQQTYTGGYSARYGRSAGGVINQIGKRGTNEMQFGGQITWAPKQWRAEEPDLYFPNVDLSGPNSNPNLPSACGETQAELCQWAYQDNTLPGTLHSRGGDDSTSLSTYSAYIGGPLIRDRLFAYVAAEARIDDDVNAPNALETQRTTHTRTDDPRVYAKIDWNITDDHLLEYTYMSSKFEQNGSFYDYDLEAGEEGARQAVIPNQIKRNAEFSILNYTGYLTDRLTLSANFGHGRFTNVSANPSIIPGVPFITNPTNQDPAITGGTPIPNRQAAFQGTDGRNYTDGLRVDLEWVVGDHALTVGIDNLKFEAKNEGTSQFAQRWIYARGDAGSDINAVLGVGAPGGDGYYVNNAVFITATSMEVEQKAWFLEDRWSVTDNLLLSLGLRNDQFTNKNDAGAVYMDAKDQWAPRIGAAWDVFGDSTLKIFGNAGRYFLAMPNNVAIRGASSSTFTSEYFTYTGIDENGAPTGLTPVPRTDGGTPRPVSSNGEYGTPVDVLAFAPSDLENMYQDEYILGFEKAFGDRWVTGAKLTYRDLKSSVDDICDPYTLMDHIGAVDATQSGSGYNAELADGSNVFVNYCYMFNPGGSNTFSLAELDESGNPTGTRREVKMSSADWGFDQGLKRTYKAIDLFLERQFDGVWEGRIDYTYSKSEGNNEGQVKSEFGQTNISKTQDWDAWQMMQFADGYLANDRRHQLKIRGSYQITPEWLASGALRVQSGTPISCLGFYNPDGSIDEGSVDADPIGYGSSYHTCLGEVAEPGKLRTPWTHMLDLGVTYRPNFLGGNFAFGLQVFNALNERKALQVDVTSETDPYTVSNTYLLPIGLQTPRYFMLTASLDF